SYQAIVTGQLCDAHIKNDQPNFPVLRDPLPKAVGDQRTPFSLPHDRASSISSDTCATAILLARCPRIPITPRIPWILRVSWFRLADKMSFHSSASSLVAAPLTIQSTCLDRSARIDHIIAFWSSERVRGRISTR